MAKRDVDAALAHGLLHGSEDAARATLANVEWLRRARVRRQLERVLADATLAVVDEAPWVANGSVAAQMHVMQLARLRLHRVPVEAPALPSEVATAYARVPAPRGLNTWPWATIGLVLLVHFVLGAAVYAYLQLPQGSRVYHRSGPAPSAQAYRQGGVPLRDDYTRRLLAQQLAPLVIAGSKGIASTEYQEAKTSFLAHAGVARRPAVAAQWRQVLAAYEHVLETVLDEVAPNELGLRAEALGNQLQRLSDAYMAHGLGYLVESKIWTQGFRPRCVMMGYEVEAVRLVQAVGASPAHPVRLVRRLDRLNYARDELGVESDRLGPLVLLDSLEEWALERVVDLREGGTFEIGATAGRRNASEIHALAQRATQELRAELVAVLGADGAKVPALGALLHERERRYRALRENLSTRGFGLVTPKSLFVPEDYLDKVEQVLPLEDSRRLPAIERELELMHAARVLGRWQDAMASQVVVHEGQHARDAHAVLPTPSFVLTELGITAEEALAGETSAAQRATRLRSEVSAYLSELASPAMLPRYSFWSLARKGLDMRGLLGTTGRLVFEQLAKARGVVPLAGEPGWPTERAMAHLVVALVDVPPAELAALAATVWSEAYGQPYQPVIVDAPTR